MCKPTGLGMGWWFESRGILKMDEKSARSEKRWRQSPKSDEDKPSWLDDHETWINLIYQAVVLVLVVIFLFYFSLITLWVQLELRWHRAMEVNNTLCYPPSGQWDDTFKYKTHPYACDYQGKYILSATMRTWSGAKLACEKAGLMLAKVKNSLALQLSKALPNVLICRMTSVYLIGSCTHVSLIAGKERSRS